MASVFAALGLYLYLIELPEQRHEETTATQAKRILPFNEADITTLTVRSQSGEVLSLKVPGSRGRFPNQFIPTLIRGRCRRSSALL